MARCTAFAGQILPPRRCTSYFHPSTANITMLDDGPARPTSISRRSVLALAAALLSHAALPKALKTTNAADDDNANKEEPMTVARLILPPLPYAYSALEPAIDKETMVLHHDKHFAKYTDGVNTALEKIPGGTAMVDGNPATLAQLLCNLSSVKDESVRRSLRNNGGGYLNHYQFFATMAPPDDTRALRGPDGDLGNAIADLYGNFEAFKKEFTAKSLDLFGSGFVYLVRDHTAGGKLAIKAYSNQDSPVMDGDVPLVGLDLWEHAYYKKYSNRRADYISAWWTVVNWPAVSQSYHQQN